MTFLRTLFFDPFGLPRPLFVWLSFPLPALLELELDGHFNLGGGYDVGSAPTAVWDLERIGDRLTAGDNAGRSVGGGVSEPAPPTRCG